MASTVSPQSAEYVDALYRKWRDAPESVDPSWGHFFQGFELGLGSPGSEDCAAADEAAEQSRVASLIFAYRNLGHRIAQTDPLGQSPASNPELELSTFGLSEEHLDRVFDAGHLGGLQRAKLSEIIDHLKQTYCGPIGVEYIHIQDRECRRWLQAHIEPNRNDPRKSRKHRLQILRNLVDATLFETFIGQRYPGQKRFSLEGAEAAIPAVHAVVEACSLTKIEEVVIGMPHRGRLNVLANILDKSYAQIFSEFGENVIPQQYGGNGDVKYHKGFSQQHQNEDGWTVHLSLTANPSHLEAVDPVVEGRARARQRRLGDTEERKKVLPLLLHGDAAFAGQGLVPETLNLSQLPGYRSGGTVHLIVNNQIGFTTLPSEARSTTYCTDVAKMIEAPVLHVNGDNPEAVVSCMELAVAFRQQFGRDVVVDMVCYRRHGHNEGDEPAFTQPLMYDVIREHKPVKDLYTERLLADGDLTPELDTRITMAFSDELQRAFDEVTQASICPVQFAPAREKQVWEGLLADYSHAPVQTAVQAEALLDVARAISTPPEGFSVHRKVARQLKKRLAAVEKNGGGIDWALAESLAFGSLLSEGTPVRLSGQDSQRGTFSHRHAVWQDVKTQQPYKPLNHIRQGQPSFCVYNSLLSEAAVLGFEYGYAMDEPRMLILWEAQFGDFANGAQVIIDQFIVASWAKWRRPSGVVMLLPHGYEGQGPEHSNAYLERYLLACAEDNIQVCNITTPAQYFHVLRRQVRRDFRRPLIIMAPKSLLRHREAVSATDELSSGTFREILDDPTPPTRAGRVVFCSGKVYYDLLARRRQQGADTDTALVRVEQFYPFNNGLMTEISRRYGEATDVVWAQEEPKNRGGWTFMEPRLRDAFEVCRPRYAGRDASASPATGSLSIHRQQQAALVDDALGIAGENDKNSN